MASRQALGVTSSRNPIIYECRSTEPRISALSQFQRTGILRFNFSGNLKLTLNCSMEDYGNNRSSQMGMTYPKPTEIPWKKELCNSVNLIGNVAGPADIKLLPSGKVVAWTRIAVRKSSTQTSWINLTFWDEMAHIASQHLEKGQQIYVSGRLVCDTAENDEGKEQTYYKVVVQQLNFIEKGLLPSTLQDSEYMPPGTKVQNSANSTGSVEELWQAFFVNPMDWWDNRKNKRNPKYPDFKHKDTGEALWVEGRYNPPWVKSQLAVLDRQMGSLTNQDSIEANLVAGDKFISFWIFITNG